MYLSQHWSNPQLMVKLTHSGTIIYATLVLIFVRQTAIKGLLKPNDSIYVNRCIYWYTCVYGPT